MAVGVVDYARFVQPGYAAGAAVPAAPQSFAMARDTYLGAQSPPKVQAGGGVNSLFAAIGALFQRIVDWFKGTAAQQPTQAAGLPGAPPQAIGQGPAQTPAGPLNMSLGPVPVEGFDGGKLANFNHQTVKYRFGRVASHFDTSPVRSGAVSPENFLRGMLPYLQAAGLQVTSIHSDKIQLLLGPEEGGGYLTIDVMRDAGPNGACAWWWGAGDRPDAGPGPAPTAVVPGPTPIFNNGPAPAAPPAAPGTPAPAPGSLQTVPNLPEYAAVTVNRQNSKAAIEEAATWVRQNHPDWFVGGDRGLAYKVMTNVIGILRANGYDAHRCVNHASRPIGDPGRYGTDSLVLNNRIYDCYVGMGDPGQSRPGAHDAGEYGNRPRE